MISEEELKCEDHIYCLLTTLKICFIVISQMKKTHEKKIFISLKKSLLDQVTANYCWTRDVCYL